MTGADKLYWLRKRGTAGLPGLKNGLLRGRDHRGHDIWTQKPAIALVYRGGEGFDDWLAEHPELEAVEVVKKGERRYHKKMVPNYVPVKT